MRHTTHHVSFFCITHFYAEFCYGIRYTNSQSYTSFIHSEKKPVTLNRVAGFFISYKFHFCYYFLLITIITIYFYTTFAPDFIQSRTCSLTRQFKQEHEYH